MRVSVIVTPFGRTRLVPRVLESIARQSYRDVEVIVVDNGSNDELDRVVHRLAASSPFLVRRFHSPDRGHSATRNRGIRVASGEAITFLDCDTEATNDGLSEMVRTLGDSGADFVYSPVLEISATGSESLRRPVAAGAPERLADEHFEKTGLRLGSTLFRRHAIEVIGEFDESLSHHAGSDFHQRAAICCTAAYIDTPSLRVFEFAEPESTVGSRLLRGLLTSLEKAVSQHPEFAEHLGPRSERRLQEVRLLLLGTLVRDQDFAPARRLAKEIGPIEDPWLRISLALGTSHPYSLAQRVRSRRESHRSSES